MLRYNTCAFIDYCIIIMHHWVFQDGRLVLLGPGTIGAAQRGVCRHHYALRTVFLLAILLNAAIQWYIAYKMKRK